MTDNGANFNKAFKDFGVKNNNIQKAIEKDGSVEIDDDFEYEQEKNDNYTTDEESVENKSNDRKSALQILPNQIKCSAHTLSLCVMADLMKVIAADVTLSNVVYLSDPEVSARIRVCYKMGK